LEKLQGGSIMATADYNAGLLNRLQDPEYASEYLNEALNEESQEVFMLALRDVAKAMGFAKAASESNLNRESMYRMLSENGNPNLSSLTKLLDTFGLTLAVIKKETVA
jgi:probable addiction module antidote protein